MVEDVDIVNEAVHVGLHGFGENVQIAPDGSPEGHENVTGIVVPETRVAIIVDDGVEEPCNAVPDDGLGDDREKSNGS